MKKKKSLSDRLSKFKRSIRKRKKVALGGARIFKEGVNRAYEPDKESVILGFV